MKIALDILFYTQEYYGLLYAEYGKSAALQQHWIWQRFDQDRFN